MNIEIYKGSAEKLRALFISRKAEMQIDKFGIELDDVKYMTEAQSFIDDNDTDMIVIFDDSIPVGYMGLEYFVSPLSSQVIANEQNWYVIPSYRGIWSIRLLQTAEAIAKNRGCSHLTMNAAMMASEMHDKLCTRYGKLGMDKYETSFIKSLD